MSAVYVLYFLIFLCMINNNTIEHFLYNQSFLFVLLMLSFSIGTLLEWLGEWLSFRFVVKLTAGRGSRTLVRTSCATTVSTQTIGRWMKTLAIFHFWFPKPWVFFFKAAFCCAVKHVYVSEVNKKPSPRTVWRFSNWMKWWQALFLTPTHGTGLQTLSPQNTVAWH